MKELIRIINTNGKETVSARELHEFLEVKTHFKDWIARHLEFIEAKKSVDYTVFKKEHAISLEKSRKDYFITLDVAKELSMLQRNERGKQARKYFIQCEKKLKEITTSQPSYTIDDRIERAQAWIEEQKAVRLFIHGLLKDSGIDVKESCHEQRGFDIRGWIDQGLAIDAKEDEG